MVTGKICGTPKVRVQWQKDGRKNRRQLNQEEGHGSDSIQIWLNGMSKIMTNDQSKSDQKVTDTERSKIISSIGPLIHSLLVQSSI